MVVACGPAVAPTPGGIASGAARTAAPSTAQGPTLTPVPDPRGVVAAPVSVAFWTGRSGIVGGATGGGEGAVARSVDGGRTWAWQRLGVDPVTAVTVSGNADAYALAPCANGPACDSSLLHSADGGATWRRVAAPAGGLLGVTAISFAGPVGWAIGYRAEGDAVPDPEASRLRKTADGGITWVELPDPCTRWWPIPLDVSFVDARHGWLLCAGEGSGTMGPVGVYESTDGGATWDIRSGGSVSGGPSFGRAPGGPVEGFAMTASGHGWVWQGRSGTARTADGGRTWLPAPPGEPEIVFVSSVWFADDMTGFAIAFDGNRRLTGLIGSDDGGTTWHDLAVGPIR